jgi:YidC/Oxa1 family membrane protein insertase
MNHIKKHEYYEYIGMIIISFILIMFLYNNDFINIRKLKSNNIVTAGKFNKSCYNKDKIQFNKTRCNKSSYIIENNYIRFIFSGYGMQIKDILIKNYKDYYLLKPLHLINKNSLSYGYIFNTINGFKINTRYLYFKPILSIKNKNFNKIVMRSKITNSCFIDFTFILDKYYCLRCHIKTCGLFNVLDDSIRHVKFFYLQDIHPIETSKKWESYYTQVYYSDNHNVKRLHIDRKDEILSINNIDWIANKQQFFSSILLFENNLPESYFHIISNVLSNNPYVIKRSEILGNIPINKFNGELFSKMKLYFIPLEYNLLQKYNSNFGKLIPLGWGGLRLLNIYFFLPIFEFLSATKLNYGIIIILMTIVVKLVLSWTIYKQYKLNVIMKVIKPDIDFINKTCINDNVKKQKLLLELYKISGIHPMSGFIPIILQVPIFYALFKFFPTVINLRGKSFLWAKDLTSYDYIINLPIYIPIYGNHVSLFTLLYIISSLFNAKICSNNSVVNVNKNSIHNNPNYLIYFTPLLMLFFINNYASGLSLYYLTSNIINIFIVLFIKKFMIKESIIRKIIEKNKYKSISRYE